MIWDVEEHAVLIRDLIDGEICIHEPMKNHTTFRIGGPADIFAIPVNIDDILRIIQHAKTNEIPLLVIGNGSNLLVSDYGIRGIVVKIGKGLNEAQFDGKMIKAQAGILFPRLSRMAADHGLSGLEYGRGIPCTLGGAIVMNAGAAGQDISQILSSVKIIDTTGKVIEIDNSDAKFAYRDSRPKNSGEVVLEATLQLQHCDREAIEGRMEELMAKRRKSMPLNYPSAGSVFKNPEDDYAGRLIDQAGCKGTRRGDAQVSEIHANCIINLGQAKASDVLELISHVQNTVQMKFDIQLELELSIINTHL